MMHNSNRGPIGVRYKGLVGVGDTPLMCGVGAESTYLVCTDVVGSSDETTSGCKTIRHRSNKDINFPSLQHSVSTISPVGHFLEVYETYGNVVILCDSLSVIPNHTEALTFIEN